MIKIPFKLQFKQSLYWNALDSLGTQLLLIMHHLLLRYYSDVPMHGAFSAMLSLFYLALLAVNVGFDPTLVPFFEIATHNKKSFISFLKKFFIPQVSIIVTFALFFGLISPQLYQLTVPLAVVIAITFIVESIKKSAKLFLQLCFFTRLTALVEFVGMLLYMFVIWSLHLTGHQITHLLSWTTLCLFSSAQMILLVLGVCYFYQRLPHTNDTSLVDYLRAVRTRFFTWLNQLGNQLLSGNFLVPLCAYYLGLNQASMLKIITSISHWITLLAQKVFGISTGALFAHTKNSTPSLQQKVFEYASAILHHALGCATIFLLINAKKLVAISATGQTFEVNSWSTLYFMILLSFFESFFILYEKWFILQERAGVLFLCNILSLGILYALMKFTNCYSYVPQLALFLFIVFVRFISFILLTTYSYCVWKLTPFDRIKPALFVAALLFSLLFYALV